MMYALGTTVFVGESAEKTSVTLRGMSDREKFRTDTYA